MISNEFISQLSSQLGFQLTGFAPAAKLTRETELLTNWISDGHNAGMGYMSRNIDKREDVRVLLPSAVSVISLAMNYFPGDFPAPPQDSCKVSRYAWGDDYHNIIGNKCREMINICKGKDSSFEAVYNVDSGPVMDKSWAVRAGIGWLGKHTNVINGNSGSWFFLATIICNKEFRYSAAVEDHCGDCTACIDACPTEAIIAPYRLDSGKCISYLTIENKNDIPAEFAGKFDNWAFGCDICQEVCPWNLKFAKITSEEAYKGNNQYLDRGEINSMDSAQFKTKFINSPLLRPKLKGIQRNLSFLEKDH